MRRVIGIDLDNTVIRYDRVSHMVALEKGLIPPATPVEVKAVRETVRASPAGDLAWQAVQAEMYGRRIMDALPAPGVYRFLRLCVTHAQPVVIISHKTKASPVDPEGTDLRQRALEWLTQKRFFDRGEYGLDVSRVYFESSRSEKISRIKSAGCADFIDDLPEVFSDTGFPDGVGKLLYAPEGPGRSTGDAMVFKDWREISEHFFSPES